MGEDAQAEVLVLDALAQVDPVANLEDGQHLVEIDTLILHGLKETGAIQPFAAPRNDFYEFAADAVRLDVPHWTCGFFLITRDAEVAAAGDAIAMRDALEALDTEFPDLVGGIKGGMTSISFYLDAVVDTRRDADLAEALTHVAPDPVVGRYLNAVADACTTSWVSTCDEHGIYEPLFAVGEADAIVGYSERLNLVLNAAEETYKTVDLDEVHITPAPLGGGKHAFLFTDALVLSSKCDSDRCRDAAEEFAAFYVSDDVLATAMMGEDHEGGFPRYLLPSTAGAMASGQVASDPIYRQLRPIMAQAIPYPTRGIPEADKTEAIQRFLEPLLHSPTPD